MWGDAAAAVTFEGRSRFVGCGISGFRFSGFTSWDDGGRDDGGRDDQGVAPLGARCAYAEPTGTAAGRSAPNVSSPEACATR